MALNFPPPSASPYTDPVSGLKYIYNTTIGGWEAAIQPPAVVSPTAPDITIPGFLWWDSTDGSLYIYYEDAGDSSVQPNIPPSSQWVEASPSATASAIVRSGINPPESPNLNELWWNTEDGNLYIYYSDPSGDLIWIQASNNGPAASSFVGSGGGATVTAGNAAPSTTKPFDLWYNTTDKTLYINYQTGLTPDWVKVHDVNNVTAVTSVTATGALSATAGTTPTITVRDGSTTQTGVIRLANTSEGINGTSTTVALSPGVLKDSIATYLTDGSTTAKGIIQLATSAEVIAGADTTKAVTPKALKDAIPSMSSNVPIGGIIQYGGSLAPTGYLKCDGSIVSRTTYSALFAVVGTTYGIGDGVTTFKLPNITGTPISCIKF